MYEINLNSLESPTMSNSGVVENGGQEVSESAIAKTLKPHCSDDTQFGAGFGWVSKALSRKSQAVTLSFLKKVSGSDREAWAKQHTREIKIFPNAYQVEGRREITELSNHLSTEQVISNLLRFGVLLASALVLMGGVLYLIRHGAEPAEYQLFQGEPAMFCSPGGVVTAILSGHRRGLVQLGLLLLIATPIARVFFSLFAFVKQRDFTYIIVNLLVLAGLIYSLLGAYL